jgi:Polyketide cyclase / dehydrase and lipid transport
MPRAWGVLEPRPVPVTVWRRVAADLEAAFDVVVPIDLAAVFRGSALLPAVTHTDGGSERWGTVGQHRTVHLADGGQLDERIVEVHRPGLFRYEVVPTHGMLRLFIRRIDGQFVFAPSEAGGTVIRWTYVFRPRRGAHGIVRAIAPAWRRYAGQVMDCLAAEVAAVGAPPNDAQPSTN